MTAASPRSKPARRSRYGRHHEHGPDFSLSARVVGERVQRLRVANSLSQAEIAQLTGIAAGVVSMIENGRQSADLASLKSLAIALNCEARYFTDPAPEVVSSRPWLRAYADASKRAVDKYVADTETAVSAIQALNMKAIPERIPTFDGDLNDEFAIEECAAAVRESAELSPGAAVGNAMRAAERLGCIVLPMDDELGRHMGMSMRVNGFPVIRVSRPAVQTSDSDGSHLLLPSGDRQRFTVAHEIGHLALHTASSPPTTAEEGSNFEKHAHRFASAFLAPAEPLLDDLSSLGGRVTLTTLQQLKERWGVAIKMLVMRLRNLDRIDDHQARSLYKQMSARKWNKVEPVTVGHESAIWFDRALAQLFPLTAAPQWRPAECAHDQLGLGGQYFDRWTDWSVRIDDQPLSSGSVLSISPRNRSRSLPENLSPGTVSQLRSRKGR